MDDIIPNNEIADETISSRLRALLATTATLSEIDLADEIVDFNISNNIQLVFDEGLLWKYEDKKGVFQVVEDAEIANVIYDLDHAPTPNHNFQAKPSKASVVLRVIKHRMADKGFFREAPEGIAVANGFIAIDPEKSVTTLEPLSSAHRQQDYLGIPYDPDAAPGHVDDYLHDTFRDKEIVDLIYEIAGVALSGQGSRYQVMFIFHGAGANGKGVITKLIQSLIPRRYRSSVPPSEWRMDFQRFPLLHSRFNSVTELPPLNPDHMETVKAISSGDTITARMVGSSGFEFEPKALHLFSANKLPPLPEVGLAIERRFLVIPFLYPIPEDRRDPNLADNLIKFGSIGFLKSAIDGLNRVLERGRFAVPEAVRMETAKWFHRSDPASVFVATCIVKTGNPKDRIPANQMFERCVAFCNLHDLSPPTSKKTLHTQLERLGLATIKSSSVQWTCVRFRTGLKLGGSGA